MKRNIALEELLEAPWKKVLLPNWIAKPGAISKAQKGHMATTRIE